MKIDSAARRRPRRIGAPVLATLAVGVAIMTGPQAGATTAAVAADIEPGETVVVSLDAAGEPAHGSVSAGIDRDGSAVAFMTDNRRMLEDERLRERLQVYVRDSETDKNALVSRTYKGRAPRQGTPASTLAVSGDGRYVAFGSSSSSLTKDSDTNYDEDVFLRDTVLGTTTLVSRTRDGRAGSGPSEVFRGGVSSDGRFVVFASRSSDLVPDDTNGETDVFLFDALDRSVVAISGYSDTRTARGSSNSPSISDDGRFVAFNSTAEDLVELDTNGFADVFVRDLQTGSVELVSLADDGGQGDAPSRSPVLSADGRYVAFVSSARNFSAVMEAGRTPDIFHRDLRTGVIDLVTRNVRGYPASGIDASDTPDMSDDGKVVVYHSRSADVVPGDTNREADVFAFDQGAEETVLVSRDQDGGFADGPSYRPVVSGDGQLVAFDSYARDIAPGAKHEVFLHRLLWD